MKIVKHIFIAIDPTFTIHVFTFDQPVLREDYTSISALEEVSKLIHNKPHFISPTQGCSKTLKVRVYQPYIVTTPK